MYRTLLRWLTRKAAWPPCPYCTGRTRRHLRYRLFGLWHRAGLPAPTVYRATYYLRRALDERL